jgi:NTP pyrophosphatase (non-canonical NTP hydrolase)
MTESEKEILLICQEECAEVTQAISKVFRFGFDSIWPVDGCTPDNRSKLQSEVGDLLAMIELMMERGIINDIETYQACNRKKTKLKTWSNIYENESNLVN